MTRLGRVEVYRAVRHRSRLLACTDDCYHDAPNIYGHVGRNHIQGFVSAAWRWRSFAANGVQIGGSTESYVRLRDLSRNLEQCFPGFRLLDQDGGLAGPDWFLYGLQATCDEAYLTVPEDLTLGMGMRGVRIPVASPVNLTSRVRR